MDAKLENPKDHKTDEKNELAEDMLRVDSNVLGIGKLEANLKNSVDNEQDVVN